MRATLFFLQNKTMCIRTSMNKTCVRGLQGITGPTRFGQRTLGPVKNTYQA